MELCLDVPRKKYTNTGKKAIYIPTIGGTLPNIAYAIPIGKISISYILFQYFDKSTEKKLKSP